MKCSLGISNFLVLLFPSISLHWSLRKAFLFLLAILWNSAFRCLYLSFSPLLFSFGFRKGRGTRDQIANIRWIIKKAREFQKNIYFCFIDYVKAFDCVDHNKLWKILKEMGIPDHLTCLLRNLYAGQEATVRTGHGTTDWFQIGKGVRQGCSHHLQWFWSPKNKVWHCFHCFPIYFPWSDRTRGCINISILNRQTICDINYISIKL